MRIRITHDTIYRYDQPVRSAIQLLRLTPRGYDGQRVVNWAIETEADARLIRRDDWYGNVMHTLYATGPASEIALHVKGEVETEDTAGVIRGAMERFPEAFYLRDTPLTATNLAMRDFAEHAVGPLANPLDRAHSLMNAIFERLQFDTDATDSTTSAVDAFEAGHGVCQDFTHIYIACARHLGTPARYVSGYLHKPDQIEQNAGHAWVETFIDELGWVSFDVTNGVSATEHYVRIATGLDYRDAAPVRGSFYGAAREDLDVHLTVEGARQTQS
jgi:transglutaminase-like putative cysteine protease